MTTEPEREPVEPLPCPFCGADGLLIEMDGFRPSSPKTYRVMCSADDECQIISMECDTESDAIAAWNRRATTVPAAASVPDDVREAIGRANFYRSGDGALVRGWLSSLTQEDNTNGR